MSVMGTFKSRSHKKEVAEEEQRILNVYNKLVEGVQHD